MAKLDLQGSCARKQGNQGQENQKATSSTRGLRATLSSLPTRDQRPCLRGHEFCLLCNLCQHDRCPVPQSRGQTLGHLLLPVAGTSRHLWPTGSRNSRNQPLSDIHAAPAGQQLGHGMSPGCKGASNVACSSPASSTQSGSGSQIWAALKPWRACPRVFWFSRSGVGPENEHF